MLNFYSKLTTAFAALAIICSTSLSAQTLTFTAAENWSSEVGFTISDCDGNILLNVVPGFMEDYIASQEFDFSNSWANDLDVSKTVSSCPNLSPSRLFFLLS